MSNRIRFDDDESSFEVFLDGDTEIPSCAFRGCTTITELDLGDIGTLAPNSFISCKDLKKVYLPQVFEIGVGSFAGCENIEEIVLGDAENGQFVYFSDIGYQLLNLFNVTTLKKIEISISSDDEDYDKFQNIIMALYKKQNIECELTIHVDGYTYKYIPGHLELQTGA